MQKIPNVTNPRPLLIYDGDCGFCRYCIDYLESSTADAVIYAPLQRVSQNYPEISEQRFADAIQRIDPNGYVSEGAEAAFQTLADGGRGGWLALYRWFPGFALVARWLYRLAARHRPAAQRVCHLLFGKELRPLEYQRVTRLFFKALALIYLFAFVSFAMQGAGLIGTQGILPAAEYFAAIDLAAPEKYWRVPSLFWISSADWMVLAIPWLGAFVSLMLLTGQVPRVSLTLLFVLYLSLVHAGQVFMRYQWDLLLLETGFVALVMACMPRLGVYLSRWLLFRFMFFAGFVKLASGDPLWASWDALTVHFQTQPLPTVFAWYAHQSPEWLLGFATLMTLAIELALPLLIFMPRRLRLWAFCGFVVLQLAIFVTGNYNFFNLLTLALCLLLLDDRLFAGMLPRRWREAREFNEEPRGAGFVGKTLGGAVAAAILVVSLSQSYLVTGGSARPAWMMQLFSVVEPFHIVNPYGVFAVMTTERNEIVLEGSMDGVQWQSYQFRFKPHWLDAMPRWATPHQPRLDWQLWFASLRTEPPPWFDNLLARLLLDSSSVEELFREVPFDGAPPQWIRAKLYRYEFTDFAERSDTGAWWKRTPVGIYRPAMQMITRPSHAKGLPEFP